jgi:hypothetical protein
MNNIIIPSPTMFGVSAAWLLPKIDAAYFISLAVVVVFTAASVVLGLVQNRLNARISKYQDWVISETQSSAAKANERAAALMKGVKWRSLDSGEQQKLASFLPKPGKKITLRYPVGDTEAGMYAGDLAGAFQLAGWSPAVQPEADARIWVVVNVFRTPAHDEDRIAAAFKKIDLKGQRVGPGEPEIWGKFGRRDLPDFRVLNESSEEPTIVVGSKLRYLPQYDPAFQK